MLGYFTQRRKGSKDAKMNEMLFAKLTRSFQRQSLLSVFAPFAPLRDQSKVIANNFSSSPVSENLTSSSKLMPTFSSSLIEL